MPTTVAPATIMARLSLVNSRTRKPTAMTSAPSTVVDRGPRAVDSHAATGENTSIVIPAGSRVRLPAKTESPRP